MSTTSIRPTSLTLDTPEDPKTAMPNDHLRALYRQIVDAKAGFDVMIDKAAPGFVDMAASFRDTHARHAEALASMLHGYVDEDGSLMGTINKAVVTMRSFFDEIDEDVMDQVRNGEKSVLEAFRDAEENCAAPHEAKLIAMRAALEDPLNRTAHLD